MQVFVFSSERLPDLDPDRDPKGHGGKQGRPFEDGPGAKEMPL